MNQWQKLVSIIESDKEKRKEIVSALGYKDPGSGTGKLLTQVRNKKIPNGKIKVISTILGLEAEEVITDYQATKNADKREQELLKQIEFLKSELETRDNFKPYIYIETSLKRPTFITGAAFLGGRMKYITELPEDILDISKLEQIKVIREIILNHYHDNDGKCPLFGDITGYIYYSGYRKGIRFSASGDIITDEIEANTKISSGVFYQGRRFI